MRRPCADREEKRVTRGSAHPARKQEQLGLDGRKQEQLGLDVESRSSLTSTAPIREDSNTGPERRVGSATPSPNLREVPPKQPSACWSRHRVHVLCNRDRGRPSRDLASSGGEPVGGQM